MERLRRVRVASGARGAAFGHLGTTREQMGMLRCEDALFAASLGLRRRVHCAVGDDDGDAHAGDGEGGGSGVVAVHGRACVVNSALGGTGAAAADAVIEHSAFGAACEWCVMRMQM